VEIFILERRSHLLSKRQEKAVVKHRERITSLTYDYERPDDVIVSDDG
jgi:hypothetical protein